MAEKKVIIQYCGGCNPGYNRKLLVSHFFKETGALEVNAQECADLALLVCGCPTQCGPNYIGPEPRYGIHKIYTQVQLGEIILKLNLMERTRHHELD